MSSARVGRESKNEGKRRMVVHITQKVERISRYSHENRWKMEYMWRMKEERRGVVLLRALWYNTQRSNVQRSVLR